VALNPDVVHATVTPIVQEVQRQTRSIPIVFANITDPVETGNKDIEFSVLLLSMASPCLPPLQKERTAFTTTSGLKPVPLANNREF
jgi:hypothetical protein